MITWLLLSLVGLALAALVIPSVRQQLLTRHLLLQFRRVMPPISETEQAALDAGTTWWDAELFSGNPDWRRLLRLPSPRLSVREQRFLDEQTEQLCQLVDDWQITHTDKDLSPAAWSYIREEGFFGLIIPEEYGGKGFSALAHSDVVMKLASRSITAAVTVMVPNSLGPGKLLLEYGTEQQKAHYLPRLARGEEIPSFALTGPEAGSDAASIPDSGVICYGHWQHRRVLGMRLNWDKRYITLGPVCTLLGLAVRLYDPDHLIGDKVDLGISLALVPHHTPGVDIGRRHIPLDIPFQNGPTQGRDVFLPLTQLIGGQSRIGQGWRMLVECLAEGRGISLPALSVGAAKTASRFTGAYAAIRQQFGLPIGRFEGIEAPLARIATQTYQMDAARTLTLCALDSGERPSVISALVKYQLTERYRRCINDAMDIHGGNAICLGPSNLIAGAYQAIPIAITVEGANILTRSMITYGQGVLRCHPWLLREFQTARLADPGTALRHFDAAVTGHVMSFVSNLLRCVTLGLTRGRLALVPDTGRSQHFLRRLTWMSSAFALAGDVTLMTLGGTLKRRERQSARLADILSELFLASAVLKRFDEDGAPSADWPLVQRSCEASLNRIQESLRKLLHNLPSRTLAGLLRVVIFPTGLPFGAPDDRLDHKTAQILLHPGRARERLTAGIFAPKVSGFRQAELDEALRLAERTAPIEKTLRAARTAGLLKGTRLEEQLDEAVNEGLITVEQGALVRKLGHLRRRVTAVDSFADYGVTTVRTRRAATTTAVAGGA